MFFFICICLRAASTQTNGIGLFQILAPLSDFSSRFSDFFQRLHRFRFSREVTTFWRVFQMYEELANCVNSQSTVFIKKNLASKLKTFSVERIHRWNLFKRQQDRCIWISIQMYEKITSVWRDEIWNDPLAWSVFTYTWIEQLQEY